MSLSQASIAHAKWSVYFFSRRKKKYLRKRFDDDFEAALAWHTHNHDKYPVVVLHCDNVGFPPPTRLTEHEKIEWRVVVVRGKRYKKKHIVPVNRLVQLNKQGIWWCPYCIQLKRFKEITTERGTEVCCPVCWVSNYSFAVRQANPLAILIEAKGQRGQRRSRGRERGTRRRRRR